MSIRLDQIMEAICYDPKSGVFSWHDGTRAGTFVRSLGYRRVSVFGRNYYEHRLAWFCVHGEWPERQIDHINGIKDDNRISNLRLATMGQQRANSPKYKNNTSGFKGVYRCKGKWAAKIYVGGKQVHLGTFESPKSGHDAYLAAAKKYFGEFARAA